MTTQDNGRKRRRGSKGPTITAVAKHAGVSAMTVSNVINNKSFVNPATREAVLAAVEALNYTPNSAARSLAAARTLRIGLLHRDIDSALLSAMLVGSLRATSRLGVQLILEIYDFTDPIGSVEKLLRNGIDGLLLPPPICEAASLAGLPDRHDVPMIGLAPGGDLRNMDCVRIDDEKASYELTRMLLDKGHRRIAIVTLPTALVAASRLRGYLRALGDAGVVADMELVWEAPPSFEAGLALAEQVLARRPDFTAVIAGNDDMAAAFVNVALRNKIAVPDELSVTGFDDTPIAVKIWPALTTVRQPLALMAEKAAERLVATLRDDATNEPPRVIYVDHQMIERQSTGPAPA
ncbi:LacI family DNA-binding transcriptional regulator [Sphingobium sp. HBC34]|uniref:LacI family DNA-binding transcriptional regulator n=1 Tax=Sphingobium cyanobacteriorum TaxID=3063954 RepID=A0ABT8ZMJ8_9SPHN|nr:LacI family DNA-binding transcriptional regulator [Sphingobium sp. HBC34]MDO7835770.1 LacI family DNA-binding transcriptional regulator [Sphingobium sp. HBC34]